jgi:hypothetical protein
MNVDSPGIESAGCESSMSLNIVVPDRPQPTMKTGMRS